MSLYRAERGPTYHIESLGYCGETPMQNAPIRAKNADVSSRVVVAFRATTSNVMKSANVNPITYTSRGDLKRLEAFCDYPLDSSKAHTVRSLNCRACGCNNTQPVLLLGDMPLANAFAKTAKQARMLERYPLELVFCEQCCLLQITKTIDPTALFKDYMYFSSYSDTMLSHARDLVQRLVVERYLNSDSLVIEIASNDGYLLKNYVELSVPVLGVEPAKNIARVAEEGGVPTLVEFFDASLGSRLASEGRRANIVHAHNVLAHVPKTNEFVQGIRHILDPKGVAVVEVPYAIDLLRGRAFDTIYHEHLFYYSLASLDHLFGRNGLTIRDVEHVDIHGGSLRLMVDTRQSDVRSQAFYALQNEEIRWGVSSYQAYENFAKHVEKLRDNLKNMLGCLKGRGKSIAAYGAAAKGSVLLNYLELGPDTIDFVVDRNPHKQGKFMPGVGIPIRETSYLAEAQPDYCLLLPWNFAEEIVAQEDTYRRGGGRFIVPVPYPRVIAHDAMDVFVSN
ncbi:MAG: class I SAM-dependent methyltransferase [Myxococcales bacterium]|nr:class I SAM-dependent methyltransferase [Myxococcales bacterium]